MGLFAYALGQSCRDWQREMGVTAAVPPTFSHRDPQRLGGGLNYGAAVCFSLSSDTIALLAVLGDQSRHAYRESIQMET